MKKGWILILGLVALFFVTLVLNISAEEVQDPVCGMKIDPAKAKWSTEDKGKKYYFCSAECQEKFSQNPEKYIGAAQEAGEELASCCSLSKELLAALRIEKKQKENGLEVTMTSDNPEVVKKLQEILTKCHQEMMDKAKSGQKEQGHKEHEAHQHHPTEGGSSQSCCLINDKNYETKIIKLNNGVRLVFLNRQNI